MPAIMIRPAVGSSEKVSGRISATPATGPSPGSTPIAVPANAPAKAASKLAGVAATLNPYSRPWREFISSRHSEATRRVDPEFEVVPSRLVEPSRNDGVSKQPLPEHAAGHLHLQQPDEEHIRKLTAIAMA